jgi:hypothetical protein
MANGESRCIKGASGAEAQASGFSGALMAFLASRATRVTLAAIVAGYLCISTVLAACCAIEEINEEPTKADQFLIEKYFGNPSGKTIEFKVKHIRNLTLIRTNNSDARAPILVHFQDSDASFSVIANLGRFFYFTDAVIEMCDRCMRVRFGDINNREADFLVTTKDILFVVP